jgi:hypothetical protein
MNVGLWCRLRAGGNQSGLIGSDCEFSAPHICMDCGLKTALVCEPERSCLRAVTDRARNALAYKISRFLLGSPSAGRRASHTSPPSSPGPSAVRAPRWPSRRYEPRGRQSGGAVAPRRTPVSPSAGVPGTGGCGTGSVRPCGPGRRWPRVSLEAW